MKQFDLLGPGEDGIKLGWVRGMLHFKPPWYLTQSQLLRLQHHLLHINLTSNGHSDVPVDVEDPLGRSGFVQFGRDQFLHAEDDAIFAPDADGRPAVIHSLESEHVCYFVEHWRCAISYDRFFRQFGSKQ